MRTAQCRLAVLAAAALVLALGLAAGLLRPVPAPLRALDLARSLPAAPPGWTVRDLPLGETETIAAAVRGILNFDSYVHREYRRGERVFTLYGAYWTAGSVPAQTVASHSPDHCWVLAGWSCLDWRSRVAPAGTAARLGPVEARRYRAPGGDVVHVWYWHLQNGLSADYGYRGEVLRYSSRWLRDGLRQMFAGSPEQFFVRLTSRQPLDELVADPGVMQLMGALADLAAAGRSAPRS